MVNLLTGQKGSGKTQKMIEAANLKSKECDGNVVFIKNSHNDTYSLSFDIRVNCMDDYPSIRNIDEYTGFLYGMLSANNDIQVIFIDGILKQASVSLENIPRFIDRLDNISKRHNVEFYVSVSASKEDLADVDASKCNYLN
jgi:hypothetical protein